MFCSNFSFMGAIRIVINSLSSAGIGSTPVKYFSNISLNDNEKKLTGKGEYISESRASSLFWIKSGVILKSSNK